MITKCEVTHKKNLRGPVKIRRTQMWVDLLWAEVDRKPNRTLLALWQQLKPVQQFKPLRLKRQRSETEA